MLTGKAIVFEWLRGAVNDGAGLSIFRDHPIHLPLQRGGELGWGTAFGR